LLITLLVHRIGAAAPAVISFVGMRLRHVGFRRFRTRRKRAFGFAIRWLYSNRHKRAQEPICIRLKGGIPIIEILIARRG
jgi:hypothetical protein